MAQVVTDLQSVEVAVDQLGRTVVVVDDSTALLLARLSQSGWVEIAGVNYGHSARVLDTTVDGALLQHVLNHVIEHFQANTGPDDQRDLSIARRGSFYGAIVGEGDWDPERRWWRDHTANRHLHVTGSLVRNQDGWRFAG